MALVIAVACLIPTIGLLIYAWTRSWPEVRGQGERMRREGGPRGADFDDFITRKMERLPVGSRTRPPRDPTDSKP